MSKIQVTPQDDPNAVSADIEIIAQYEIDKRFRFLCFVEPGKNYEKENHAVEYISKCVRLAFQKQGYTFGRHANIQPLFPVNGNKWYVYFTCEK